MAQNLENDINKKLYRFKQQFFERPNFLIVDEVTFRDMQDNEHYIHDFQQRDVRMGNTYLGLAVSVLLGRKDKRIVEVA